MNESGTSGSLQELFSGLDQLANAGTVDIGVAGFALVLLASLLSSLYISALYVRFYGGRSTGSQVHRAFALLGLSVTSIFICIQFSLPLSLGLLGALSIVRFRTPIKEPEEIGFIMLVIAASISAATFSMYFLGVLLVFATVLMLVQRSGLGLFRRDMDDGLILVTLPSDRYRGVAEELHRLLDGRLRGPRIESISKAAENSVVTYSFNGIKEGGPVELQSAIQEMLDPLDLNIYLNKHATL